MIAALEANPAVKAIGAATGQPFPEFLVEAIIIAIISDVIGVGLGEIVAPTDPVRILRSV